MSSSPSSRSPSAAVSVSAFMIYARTTQRVPVIVHFPSHWSKDKPIMLEVGEARSSQFITDISAPEGRVARKLTLDNGNKIFISSDDMPAFLNQKIWAERLDKAERSSFGLLISVSVFITLLFGAATYFLFPKMADKAADYIPDSLVNQISEATIFQLDSFFLDESRLPDAKQQELYEIFIKLREQADLSQDITLLYRSSTLLGANALALPGGPVVLLDDLVTLAPSNDGIAGVLAHELAHIALRHNRKTIARDGLYSLIAIMMSGGPDIAAGSEIMKNLVFSGYSREFEEEADLLARQWMTQAGYDLAAFDEMLIALYQQHCDEKSCDEADKSSGWFDTHPSLSERLSLQGQ